MLRSLPKEKLASWAGRGRGISRRARLALGCAALACALACASSEPPIDVQAAPAPALPAADPFSAPGGGSEEPPATETNFITLICLGDADCAPGERCTARPAADAGSPDAGIIPGRCVAE